MLPQSIVHYNALMPSVMLDNQTIAYTVVGSGPPLILLHGLFLDSSIWAASETLSRLAVKFTVVTMDALDHGGSDKPVEQSLYSGDLAAQRIAGLLDHIGMGKAHIVGHSMGAWHAAHFAKRHPFRTTSLALIGYDPANGPIDVPFPQILAWARAASPELTEWITPSVEPGLAAIWQAMRNTPPLLHTTPSHLLCGEADPYLEGIATYAQNHDIWMSVVPGDHLSAITQHGKNIAAVLIDYIEKLMR
jgi:pimeloyl-ACP methyl ester carboxylesterase